MERMLEETADLRLDRRYRLRSIAALLSFWLRRPALWAHGLRWAARLAWRMRRGLWHGRGRVGKISFFVHNFMDACALERARITACTFMVATTEGMQPMCLVNAQRDRFILSPVAIERSGQRLLWNPITGTAGGNVTGPGAVRLSRKTAKGRARTRRSSTGNEPRET